MKVLNGVARRAWGQFIRPNFNQSSIGFLAHPVGPTNLRALGGVRPPTNDQLSQQVVARDTRRKRTLFLRHHFRCSRKRSENPMRFLRIGTDEGSPAK